MNPKERTMEELKIQLFYPRAREYGECLDDYLKIMARSLAQRDSNELDSRTFQEEFFNTLPQFIDYREKNRNLWGAFQEASHFFVGAFTHDFFGNRTFSRAFSNSEGEERYQLIYDLLRKHGAKAAVEIMKARPELQMNLFYDPQYERALELTSGSDKTVELSPGILTDHLESWDEKVEVIEADIALGKDQTETGEVIREVYAAKEALENRVHYFGAMNKTAVPAPWEKNEKLSEIWRGTVPFRQEDRLIDESEQIHKGIQGKILLTYGKEFSGQENGFVLERCENYVEAIAIMIEKQKETKDLSKDVLENFLKYIEPDQRQGNLWGEFQKVSRKFEEFHLENILKWEESSRQIHPVYDVKQSLNQWVGKMAVELAKENPQIALGIYYDPQLECVKYQNLDRPLNALEILTTKLTRDQDLYQMEKALAKKEYVSGTSHCLNYLYRNEEQLSDRIYFYDRKSRLNDEAPWSKKNELGTIWKEMNAQAWDGVDMNAALTLAGKLREKQKISFFFNRDEIRKGKNNKKNIMPWLRGYFSAIADTLIEHQSKLSDPGFRQYFFEHATEYILPEKKHWVLWDDWQKVSRGFEELKLETICKELNVNFDHKLDNSFKKNLVEYLGDMEHAIAIEIAKINPMVELNVYYDPTFFHALEVKQESFGATELIEIVEGWEEGIALKEKEIADGTEGSYSSQALQEVYPHHKKLTGRICLFDEKNNISNELPWERNEKLARIWEEKCKKKTLTPVAGQDVQHPSNKRKNIEEGQRTIEQIKYRVMHRMKTNEKISLDSHPLFQSKKKQHVEKEAAEAFTNK
ncbi:MULTISPECIES: hypothetical protein [unclassified Enterococcus]|uniref:hypothetical protein n=1 Tax=unclassified Enterococcus TaxID=2608891 RepID=UPI0013EC4F10|nr:MULTISPECIES: hypothetical protein [unclassified Enterococcus]